MLTIHFLNVGHGDCTVIEHSEGGRLTVVDINNGGVLDPSTAAELADVFGVSLQERLQSISAGQPRLDALIRGKGYDVPLTKPCGISCSHISRCSIFRYLQSHPDLDHMRGLSALAASNVKIWNLWDRSHDRDPDMRSASDAEEWKEYQELRSGSRGNGVLRLFRGDVGAFWNQEPKGIAGGDGIYILSPDRQLERRAAETNTINTLCYVLMIRYGGTRVVLGSDANKEAWDSIVAAYGGELKCDVLKASHHGRESGYHQQAVSLMAPKYTVVSVGPKPETDASNKYRRYSPNVWSTRWKGDITLRLNDDGSGTISPQYDR